MAVKTMYSIIGRYTENGVDIVAYELQNDKDMTHRKFSREAVCYLIGKGAITNATGQIYKNSVYIRAQGTNFQDMKPIQIGDRDKKATRKLTNDQVLAQYAIVKKILDKNKVVGYMLQNRGGIQTPCGRQKVIQLANEGKIINAYTNAYNGNLLLRGKGINLNELESIDISEVKKKVS